MPSLVYYTFECKKKFSSRASVNNYISDNYLHKLTFSQICSILFGLSTYLLTRKLNTILIILVL